MMEAPASLLGNMMSEDHLSYETQRLTRRGYYKLTNEAISQDQLEALSEQERFRYYTIGLQAETREAFITKAKYGVAIFVLILGGLWLWSKDSHQKSAEKAAVTVPTYYNSPTELFSATFPNKPGAISDNPDEEKPAKVGSHLRTISGSSSSSGDSSSGLYSVDTIHYTPPFDELDCIIFLGDLQSTMPKENFKTSELIELSDGRPTLNYTAIRTSDDKTFNVRAAVTENSKTNICYRFSIAKEGVVDEAKFRDFLNTVQIRDANSQ